MPSSPSPSSSRRRRFFAFPSPHFMGLAPLDVWGRVLNMAGGVGGGAVGWRYWPRLGFALFSSTISTALTLPERLIVPRLLMRPRRDANATPFQTLVILGYYRSGTTHLHYLLCCDKRFVTPRWYQALAPQGFVLSWSILRFALIPFLAATRPQDDVAYGPEWPVEDDFALCCMMGSPFFGEGAGGSSLPGRFMFSEPATVNAFMRYHDLRGVSEHERDGFRRSLRLFAEKIVRAETMRRRIANMPWVGRASRPPSNEQERPTQTVPVLLLKTPSHTARVRELLKTFGEGGGGGGAKFIHLSREPGAVLRSNVAMHERLEPHRLQDEPSAESIRAGIIEEYARTERRFLEDEPLIPQGHLTRLRFDELTADPIGSLKRVYAALNIDWCTDAERRMRRYLAEIGEYRAGAARHDAAKGATPRTPAPAAPPAQLPDELAWMTETFGHNAPKPVPDAGPELRSGGEGPGQPIVRSSTSNMLWSLLTSTFIVAAGLALIGFIVRDRIDVLAWPAGIALGGLTLRGVAEARGKGSRPLGLAAALLTILVVLALAMPLTWWESYADRTGAIDWHAVQLSTTRGVFAKSSLVWLALGAVSAYRLASRTHTMPPGDEF